MQVSKLAEINSMQAHPVPQNIMQVEFQLVGNLTLRQFGYLAAGGVLAWIIFISPLLTFVKYPLAVTAALFGAALAFLPVNDMRLEKWIIAFFKAIYSPTRRVWRKEVENIDFLTDKFTSLVARPALIHTIRAGNRAKLDLYLNTTRTQIKNNLDQFEERKLSTLDFTIATPTSLTASPDLAPEALPTLAAHAEEAPRIVEQQSQAADTIASQVIFTPIATIKLPDRNIFVKGVSNKRAHSLNPKTAHQGTILLPIRGERIFQISQEIKQKLNRYVKPMTHGSTKPEVLMSANPAPPRPQYTPAGMPNLPTPKPVAPPPVHPFASQTPQVAPISPTPTPTSNPAERSVVNVFVSPPPVSPPPPPAQETKSEETSLPPSQPLQETNNESLKQNIRQLTSEESLLKEEVEKYKNQEKYLAGQLSLREKENTENSNAGKLKELEEQMHQMRQEKDRAEERAHRLEGLITQLSTSSPKEPQPTREIVTPQAAQAPKEAEIHVVAPRRAEGKMAPPMTTVPNVINGVVKDVNGLLLSQTIIVVKDKNDEPVRALKTNQVGQFAISTALPNGTYLMEVEKEGYEFDYIEIKLTGEILAPIEIRARGGQNG